MRPFWPVGVGLLLLALAFSVGGCSSTDTYDGGPAYPCGPNSETGRYYHENFLEWTPDGVLLIFSYGHSLNVVSADGARLRDLVQVNRDHDFRFGFYADVSPDGRSVVYSTCEFQTRENHDYEIAIINIDGTGMLRLTSNTHADHYPVWSSNGSRIAFIAEAQDIGDVYVGLYLEDIEFYTMKADGTDVRLMASTIREIPAEGSDNQKSMAPSKSVTKERKELTGSFEESGLIGITLTPSAWSSDGVHLAFLVNEGPYLPFQRVLYTGQIDGSGLTRIAEDVVSVAAWSPDGQLLAVARYVGDEVALFTMAADGSDPKQITTITARKRLDNWYGWYKTSIHTVSWSPEGSHVLYTCDQGVCVVDVRDGSVTGLVQGGRQSREPYIAAWSPDGSRIAIYTPGYIHSDVTTRLYTVARDGTDRRDLIRVDDGGNLVPAYPPQDE